MRQAILNILSSLLILTFVSSALAQRGGGAAAEAPKPESFTFVTMDFQVGSSVSSFINQNGNPATFKGLNYAFDLNFIANLADGAFAFGPFVHWHRGDLSSNVAVSGIEQSTEVNDVIYGLKFVVFPFYGGFGFGDLDLKMKSTDTSELALTTKQLGFTAGFLGFKLTDSTYLGVNGWYKSGFINAADNPTSDNTKFDSWEIYLRLTIYPAFELL